MRKVALAVLLGACSLAMAQDNLVVIKFSKCLSGKMIGVLVDGRVEKSFAGKMGFQDANHSWQSVCADIHSPVSEGQFFKVRPVNSEIAGGNYAKAGRIVAKYFNEAKTPAQCAGLQIAVWEAIEVGGEKPDFIEGKFQVRADDETMYYATLYYAAIQSPGDSPGVLGTSTVGAPPSGNSPTSTLLLTGGQGQSQLSPATS